MKSNRRLSLRLLDFAPRWLQQRLGAEKGTEKARWAALVGLATAGLLGVAALVVLSVLVLNVGSISDDGSASGGSAGSNSQDVAGAGSTTADSESSLPGTRTTVRASVEQLSDDLAAVDITIRLPASTPRRNVEDTSGGGTRDAAAGNVSATRNTGTIGNADDQAAYLTLAELGVTLQVGKTIEAVEAAIATGASVTGTGSTGTGNTSLASEHLRFTADPVVAESALRNTILLAGRATEIAEVIVQNGTLAVRINTDYVEVDYDLLLTNVSQTVADDSSAAIADGIAVVVPTVDRSASLDPSLYQFVADEASSTYSKPPVLAYGDRSEQLPLETVVSWLKIIEAPSRTEAGALIPGETRPTITLRYPLVQPAIEALFSTADGDDGAADSDDGAAGGDAAGADNAAGDGASEVEATKGVFVVSNDRVRIMAEDGAVTCCASGSAPEVIAALDDANRGTPLRLASRAAIDAEQLEHLQSLQIMELVGEFTTRHPCCQDRVTNIQRMADIMRGSVIEPGASLSVNERVGRRTAEDGFVEGGFIQHGVLVKDVGGGVSQFATTMFNAAFFAGLEIDEYQMHSLYFSRYPFGREATLSYPKPDLVVRNQTPYGVLVWTSYTSTSITVSLYSTKHIEVTVEDPVVTERGECQRVRTIRTRTYTDDSAEPEDDSFFATYRPQEGYNCDGTPSDPEAVVCPDPLVDEGTNEDEIDIETGGEAGVETEETIPCVPLFTRDTTTTTTTTTVPSTNTGPNTDTGTGTTSTTLPESVEPSSETPG